MTDVSKTPAVLVETIVSVIVTLRGRKVMLDADLAELYGVSTRVLVQAVKRNGARFPDDFMLELEPAEWESLRSQSVISKRSRGGRRYSPYAFTEQGVAMLSSVLRSERAVAVNIQIMRAFVQMRELLTSNRELARRLDELESRIGRKLATQDASIAAILAAIRELTQVPGRKRRGIGFTADLDES